MDDVSTKRNDKRIQRGGSFSYTGENCRSAFRNYNHLVGNYDGIGFRVVCSV